MSGFVKDRHGNLHFWFRVTSNTPRITVACKVREANKGDVRWAEKTIKEPVDRMVAARKNGAEELLNFFPESEKLREVLSGLGWIAGSAIKMIQLFDELETDYIQNGQKSLASLRSKLKVVREYFAEHGIVYVTDLTTTRVAAFKAWLIAEGYANASVNRHLAAVRRALNLAALNGRIEKTQAGSVVFNTMNEDGNRRTGVFLHHEMPRLIAEHPAHLRVVVHVAYRTGWRMDAILSRRKSHVVLDSPEGDFLVLDAEHAKNRKECWFPLKLFPELRPMLEAQLAFVRKMELELGRVIPWLFPSVATEKGGQGAHRDQVGQRMHRFDTTWEEACERAGLNTDPDTREPREQKRLFHDFRRTAETNLWRLGLTDTDIMAVMGWDTLLMRQRYQPTADRGRMSEMVEKARRNAPYVDARVIALAPADPFSGQTCRTIAEPGCSEEIAGAGLEQKD